MKDLRMPHTYAAIPETEQSGISGGGPLQDALDAFLGNFQFDDLFFSSGLISFSFSFVPLLLFNVVKAGVDVALGLYHDLSGLFGGFSQESREVVQYLSAAREQQQQRESQPPVV